MASVCMLCEGHYLQKSIKCTGPTVYMQMDAHQYMECIYIQGDLLGLTGSQDAFEEMKIHSQPF